MRGDRLSRQWWGVQVIEANPNGLTVADLAKEEETGIRPIYRGLEALQAAGFPLYTERVDRANRWAFIDTFKFKIPTPFTLTELICPHFNEDLVWALEGNPFYDSLDSMRVFREGAR